MKAKIIACVLLFVMLFASCGDAEKDIHKNEKVSIEELELKVKPDIYEGYRCALFSYKNNSDYKINSMRIIFKAKDDLTEIEIKEARKLIKKDIKMGNNGVTRFDAIDKLDLSEVYFSVYLDEAKKGKKSKGETGYWCEIATSDNREVVAIITDVNFRKYFEEDIAEFTYEENGETHTVYYDYVNKTYIHK